MFQYRSLLAVALGGAVGATTRWGALQIAVGEETAGAGPATHRAIVFTIAINVLGSFLLGVLIAQKRSMGPTQFLAAGAGFAGGLTTFSTFAVAVAEKLDNGEIIAATSAGFGTAVAAVLAAGLGYRSGRMTQ